MNGVARRPRITAACGALLLAVLPAAARPRQDAAQAIDSLGRPIVFPARVERIISLEPEITRLTVALGAGDKLVGLDYFLRHHDHLFATIFPRGRRLPVVANGGQELNLELALKLAPDLVFCSPTEAETASTIEARLRVPVVALASRGRFDALLDELRLLGRILGRDARAAALEKVFRDKVGSVRRAVAAVPPEKRPRVYLTFWGEVTRTPVSYDPVEAAGGVNVVSGLLPQSLGSAGTTVSLEKLVAWDPDVILIQGNYLPSERRVTVAGLLADARLGSLKAVRTKRVYYTFGYWYWWDPALALVETAYLARILNPGACPDFDLEREGNALYREFYGVEGAFTRLSRFLGCDEWPRE